MIGYSLDSMQLPRTSYTQEIVAGAITGLEGGGIKKSTDSVRK